MNNKGSIVYCEYDNAVRKLDFYGNEVWCYHELTNYHSSEISSLVIDNNDNIITGSFNKIIKCDPSGNILWKKLDTLHSVNQLNIIDNKLLAYCKYKFKLIMIDLRNGKTLYEIIFHKKLKSIVIDDNNDIIVVDNNQRVLLYDVYFNIKKNIITFEKVIESMVYKNGFFYVSVVSEGDSFDQCFLICFNYNGEILFEKNVIEEIQKMNFVNNNILFANNTNCIMRLDKNGNTKWVSWNKKWKKLYEENSACLGFHVDSDGKIYQSKNKFKIEKYDKDLNLLWSHCNINSEFTHLISTDSKNNVVVAAKNGVIFKIDNNGKQLWELQGIIETPKKLQKYNDNMYYLSERKIRLIDYNGFKIKEVKLPFKNLKTFIIVDGRIIVLGYKAIHSVSLDLENHYTITFDKDFYDIVSDSKNNIYISDEKSLWKTSNNFGTEWFYRIFHNEYISCLFVDNKDNIICGSNKGTLLKINKNADKVKEIELENKDHINDIAQSKLKSKDYIVCTNNSKIIKLNINFGVIWEVILNEHYIDINNLIVDNMNYIVISSNELKLKKLKQRYAYKLWETYYHRNLISDIVSFD